jgi:hypothetical protein
MPNPLHRHYHDSTTQRVRTQNDRLRWQNQLSKQLAHKALDEPLLEDDDMHIDARRNTHITRTGVGLKDLLLLTTLALPLIGTAGLAGAAFGPLLLGEFVTSQEPEAATATDESPDTDTRIVPRVRFGPEEPAAR